MARLTLAIMWGVQDVWRREATLEKLMARKLRLRHGPLRRRAALAKRDLPRAVRRDLQMVGEAAALSANPRIARQIDHAQVEAAFQRARHHLTGSALTELRKTRRLRWLAGLLFNLALAAASLAGLLWWHSGL